MFETWQETARRLVALDGFEWREGMRVLHDEEALPETGAYLSRYPMGGCYLPDGCYPDLTDDATAGVMLGVLAEALPQADPDAMIQALNRVASIIYDRDWDDLSTDLAHAAALVLVDVLEGS
jgi:hypothetical protein